VTFVVGASAHGSPGVSTALQLVAAAMGESSAVPVVVEADGAGGVLAARYELALTPGFVTLAESLRKSEVPPLLDNAQRLPSGVACVPLSPSASAAGAQMRSAGPFLGPYLAESRHPVLLDAGTVVPDSKVIPALTAADLLLWFVRPTREELLVLRHRLAECTQPDNVAIVLVGGTPYNAEQVAEALEVQVLHTLPIDRRGAEAANLGGDDRFLRRSQLNRSCGQLASLITQHTAPSRPPPPPPPPSPSPRPSPPTNNVGPLRGPAEPPSVEAPPPPPAAQIDVSTPDNIFASQEASEPELVVWVNDED